ncbi:MAG: hypothetical protein QW171_04140 [Candidatus Bilamarchaeaceae archaeon]
MKKVIALVFLFALLLVLGCVEQPAKIGCCAKENATKDGKCALLNMTTSVLEDYYGKTHWCNLEEGNCNVTIGDRDYLVPICTDAELNECIDPNCTAMICGDFIFKPKISPGVVQTAGGEAAVDVPPEQEEEKARIGFYKAQCKFMKMDNKLASVMKSTDSAVNVFRFGVGGSFNEFERYRYLFPSSDKYCGLSIGVSEKETKIDRYMNYLGASDSSLYQPYNPLNMPDCIDDSKISTSDVIPLAYGPLVYPEEDKYTGLTNLKDRSEYNFEAYYEQLVPWLEDQPAWNDGPYFRIDRAFYRKGLSTAYAKTIFNQTVSRAPFECSLPTDCYSGTCSFDFYSRGVNIAVFGEEEREASADCNSFTDVSGNPIVVCSSLSSVGVGGEGEPSFTYAPVTVKMAKIKIEVDEYDAEDIGEVEDCEKPGNLWILGCIGDCTGKGGDHRCELRNEWCDFAGGWERDRYDKKFYDPDPYCSDRTNVLDYNISEQVVSRDFTIAKMPAGIRIERRQKKECTHFYGDNDETTEVDCPILEGETYPPAGGFVFFGTGRGGEAKVKWKDSGGNERTVVGYAFVNQLSDTMFLRGCPTGDYEIVEIGPPDGANWQRLMDAFALLFEERLNATQHELKGTVNDGELILSSIPWILAYKRIDNSPVYSGGRYTLSSMAAQKLRERNIFEFPEPQADGTSTQELDKHSVGGNDDTTYVSYLLLYPKNIILFYGPPQGSDVMGNCKLDKSTGLPALKQYGWCEPCTGSTLAYESVRNIGPYLPENETIISRGRDDPVTREECTHQFSFKLVQSGSEIFTRYYYPCIASWITDVEELNGYSTRTYPPATVLKERIGNYMKSGILPVINLADGSNWAPEDYEQNSLHYGFPFEDVFGEMGAAVVIVDTIDMYGVYTPEAATALLTEEKKNNISERARIVKSKCWRCIPAVEVWDPENNESLDALLSSMFSDPRLRMDIDMIAFWYRPFGTGYEHRYRGGETDDERADATVDDMLSFSKTILKYGKPSIITRFATSDKVGIWKSDNSAILFNKIVDRSGELANSGLIGIIYAPASGRTLSGTPEALVEGASGTGIKGEKFCNLQRAINRFLVPSPTMLLSQLPALESVNCTQCSSLDVISGKCSRICANGVECTVPEGADPSRVRCPPDTVVEPCRLCDETPGIYRCTFTFSNGTSETHDFASSLISSDAYMEVIGGLEPPNKCCIRGETGLKYSYGTTTIPITRAVPIVYPRSGRAEVDCGASNLFKLTEGSFCGKSIMQRENYKVTCEFIPS